MIDEEFTLKATGRQRKTSVFYWVLYELIPINHLSLLQSYVIDVLGQGTCPSGFPLALSGVFPVRQKNGTRFWDISGIFPVKQSKINFIFIIFD